MKGLNINSVVGRDAINLDGSVVPAFYMQAQDIPDVYKDKYKKITCKYHDETQDIFAHVDERKLLVIKGIPFYASSGTSDDQCVISPAWRKDVWMPFMGWEAHGSRAGRIAKLGDKCSKKFSDFIDDLVKKWSEEKLKNDPSFDESLKLAYKKQNRPSYDRYQILEDLAVQLKRFGAFETFAFSMQLLPANVWVSTQLGLENEENFAVLRDLRNYFFHNYEYPLLSDRLINDVNIASFEEWNEDYHILETNNDQLQLVTRRSRNIRDESRKKQIDQENREYNTKINNKLMELGAETAYIATLNNPSAPIVNTLATKLSDLILKLNQHNSQEAKVAWEKSVEEIIDNLIPLEQEMNLEAQKERYKNLFDDFFELKNKLEASNNIQDMSTELFNTINSIETLDDYCKEKLPQIMLESLYSRYLLQLQDLSNDGLKTIGEKKPAYQVLYDLNKILSEDSHTAKEKVNNFFEHLSSNNNHNLEILQKDNSRSTKKFLQGIAVIAAIVCTGILPGLAITKLAKVSISDFFKPQGKEFSEQINQFTLKK